MKRYVGLDIASATGICILDNTTALVNTLRGTPVDQVTKVVELSLQQYFKNEIVFVLEEPHHTRNWTTVVSLLERYGYIKWVLKSVGYPVEEINVNSARHWLGVKDKAGVREKLAPLAKGRFSFDEADATLLALYQAHQDGWDVRLQSIEHMENQHAKSR